MRADRQGLDAARASSRSASHLLQIERLDDRSSVAIRS